MNKNESVRKLYCVACGEDVYASKVSGDVVYPNRYDLKDKKFWRCEACGNYVSAINTGTVIPDASLRVWRSKIHAVIDPVWRSGVFSRKEVYKKMRAYTGKDFHGGGLRSEQDAAMAYKAAARIRIEAAVEQAERIEKKYAYNAKRKAKKRH